MRCSQGRNGRRRSKPSIARTAASIASWAMSSAAAVSCTIRNAVRCAASQWRRTSVSTASAEPFRAWRIRVASSLPPPWPGATGRTGAVSVELLA